LLQRLGLAQALIGSPRAILLDETLWGEGLLFDKDIIALLTKLSRRGVTILISAPNPVELHRVAGRIVMMAEGRVVSLRRTDPAFAEAV
jgi:ABC-type multidrug transport system ATPase subunit